ncbi:MAG: hypothetical protein RTV31_02355, partial [Candidatus Thorarchaeota archaeon]
AYSKFKKLRIVKDTEWTLEQVTTQAGLIVRIVNPETKLSICDRTTFVTNPENTEKAIIASKEIFSDIAAILNSSLDVKEEKK